MEAALTAKSSEAERALRQVVELEHTLSATTQTVADLQTERQDAQNAAQELEGRLAFVNAEIVRLGADKVYFFL